jgi:hypothetical protein
LSFSLNFHPFHRKKSALKGCTNSHNLNT